MSSKVTPYTIQKDSPPTKKKTGRNKQSKTDTSLSYRLKRRKNLLNRLQMIVNFEFVLEMIGFLTMLTTTEFYIQKIYPNNSNVILALKLVMTSSTVLLMVAVFIYHMTSLNLLMNDKNVDDWRMVITLSFVLKAVFELMICAIHPIPGDVKMQYVTINGKSGRVSVDAILSILMLLRLYIVAKFVMTHSQWMLSTSMQSIGALNKVEIDANFILRCLMKDHPGMLIVSIMFGIFIINSWAMRTCESYYVPDTEQSGMLDSMWLVAITFLTVGYGDLSPNSYCGRVIAAETGLMGVAITAMLVTVMTSKFGQTRAERYVHAFMARINLEKNKKNAAADIIKLTMMNWMMKRHNKLTNRRKMMYQMKLSRAVQTMHEVHLKNLNIIENAIGIVEVSTNVENVGKVLTKIRTDLTNAAARDQIFEARLKRIDSKLNAILNGLNLRRKSELQLSFTDVTEGKRKSLSLSRTPSQHSQGSLTKDSILSVDSRTQAKVKEPTFYELIEDKEKPATHKQTPTSEKRRLVHEMKEKRRMTLAEESEAKRKSVIDRRMSLFPVEVDDDREKKTTDTDGGERSEDHPEYETNALPLTTRFEQ